MSDNPAKHEVLLKQNLRSVLDISVILTTSKLLTSKYQGERLRENIATQTERQQKANFS